MNHRDTEGTETGGDGNEDGRHVRFLLFSVLSVSLWSTALAKRAGAVVVHPAA